METTMNKIIKLLISTPFILSLISSCASSGLMSRMSHSERNNVFTETLADEVVPAGYADVVMKASIKTPLPGYYVLEPKRSLNYLFLINIDGQAVTWKVEGHRNSMPEYVDGKTNYDPEGGDGMKYVLQKTIRLEAGSHRLFFGLPEESYYKTVDISVKSGGLYYLEFKPEYRYKTAPTRIPTFLEGLNDFEIVFKEIKRQ